MQPRICLGIPSGDMVHGRFMLDTLALVLHSKDLNIDTINYRSSRITGNRNGIVEAAYRYQATHVMFIDADMTFPRNGLLELLRHDKDIVCATATKREEGENGPIGLPLTLGEATTNKRLIQMKFVGMPFMLIKMGVFDKLAKPYFAEPIIDGELVPEDDYFCKTALEAGFDIWCDLALSMQMGHMGVKEYKIASVQQRKPELRVVGAA